jgi:hypothetical protein
MMPSAIDILCMIEPRYLNVDFSLADLLANRTSSRAGGANTLIRTRS